MLTIDPPHDLSAESDTKLILAHIRLFLPDILVYILDILAQLMERHAAKALSSQVLYRLLVVTEIRVDDQVNACCLGLSVLMN